MALAAALALALSVPVLGQVAPENTTPEDTAPETETEPAPETPAEPESQDPVADAAHGPATLQEDPQAVLDELERNLVISRERANELRAEIEAIEGDQTAQAAALIAAAQRVQLAEIEITDIEERLDTLIVEELSVRGRLDGADAEIANVLAALARISRNPPPALIVDPDDALGSARGAILIAAVLPQLQERAEAVRTDLTELETIKQQVLAEEEQLRANFAVLEEEQLRIATLILARRRSGEQLSAELAGAEEQAAALAARATDLKALIEGLSERVEQSQNGEPAEEPLMTPEEVETAFANLARTEPAVPFELARGHLARPATGETVLEFGSADGMGGISSGLSIRTTEQAAVRAPADGWVLYRGPYLNYGQIVILNTGQTYTVILAGLETVSVEIGQFVLRGQTLGTMGSRTSGRSVTTSAGASQPTLYIELRNNNEPIDPAAWWAVEQATT
jgi:septal ring factor EnvC (AmiA/AmiB activator)